MFRFLQYYPACNLPYLAVESDSASRLQEVMAAVIAFAEQKHTKAQETNVANAVLFESVNCLIHISHDSPLMTKAIQILGNFLNGTDVNLRYLALETMTHIASLGDPRMALPQYEKKITECLADPDISIRKQTLELLYSMCNQRNAERIVSQLLSYLSHAEEDIKEEAVLKIAILAEKYVTDYTWYVDVILKLITTAGDEASDAVCHRVVHIVTNHEDSQEYAAYTMMQALKQPHCHEAAARIAGYILGEFGHLIVESPGCSPFEQFMAFQSKFFSFSKNTKAIILSTYFKFVNLFPEIKKEIMGVLERFLDGLDTEIQQRANEYYNILQMPTDSLLQVVCAEMPHFSDKESSLLIELKKKTNDTEDARVWTINGNASNTANESIKHVQLTQQVSAIEDLLDMGPAQTVAIVNPTPLSISEWLAKLQIAPSGILYEDSILQIGIKTQYEASSGRIAVFYGNKSMEMDVKAFNASISSSEAVRFQEVEAISPVISAGSQSHQIFNVECVSPPEEAFHLNISFKFAGNNMRLSLELPISVAKFISPVSLSGQDFFMRWKQIGGPPKEVQTIFKPINGIGMSLAHSQLQGLGLQVLEGVDPNADNAVAAGIFSSLQLGKVGSLIRIESNRQHVVLIFYLGIQSYC